MVPACLRRVRRCPRVGRKRVSANCANLYLGLTSNFVVIKPYPCNVGPLGTMRFSLQGQPRGAAGRYVTPSRQR